MGLEGLGKGVVPLGGIPLGGPREERHRESHDSEELMMKWTIMIAFLQGLVTAVTAQSDPTQMALDIAKAQKQNTKALTRYSWKMRTEIKKDGETKSTRLYQMRFDFDGKLQKTAMGGEGKAPKKKRGLRGRIQEKKMDEAKDYGEKIVGLIRAYTMPSTGDLVDFFEKATFRSGSGSMAGSVRVMASGYLRPGDTATMWVDTGTLRLRKLTFRAPLDGNDTKGTVDYRTLTGGPSYPARTVVEVPEKSLKVIVENFDYLTQ